MAAVAVQTYVPSPYDHRAVEALPTIASSAKKLDELAGYSHIRSCVRDVFMRHGVNEVFGVALLHRHYDIAPDEKIVELGPVSSPWVVSGDEEDITGGSILPHSWRVFDGDLKPTEFKFVPKRDMATLEKPVFPPAFVKDLVQVLSETGLDGVLGIQLIDHERGRSEEELMEITYGRSSIMIPAVSLDGSSTQQAFTAAWSFVPKKGEEDAVSIRHGICVDRVDDGVATRHGICVDRVDDGVATRHGICVDRVDDGVATRHGICVDRVDDGVATRHGICVDRVDDGVATRHGICVDRVDDGVATRHGICVDRVDDGVATRHGICVDRVDDGVATRHGICVDRVDDGVATRHGICVDRVDDGVATRHGICVD